MKSRTHFVGIDLGKRKMEVVRLSEDSKPQRIQCPTTQGGMNRLCRWLTENDHVVIEAGTLAFRLAKFVGSSVGCQVTVLNPSELAMIYNSLKKTDSEDSLKLARLAQRIPVSELPVFTIPTDQEEDNRRLVTEQEHWTKARTKSINRLHSLFTQSGITDIKKRSLSTEKNRLAAIRRLEERFRNEGERLLKTIDHFEDCLSSIDQEIKDQLKEEQAYTHLAMSMPGIGPKAAFILLSFLGKGDRFSHPSQVSYYAGLVPKVDISGDTVKYGRIINRGCRQIKRVMLQCSWGLILSNHGGPIQEFYLRLQARIGKKKAAVAVARKMVETFYVMLRTGEVYRDVPEEVTIKKLKTYGLI